MPKRLKRYEILLPLKYNDGTEVEQGKFHETRGELIDRFGAVTIEPVPSKGFWLNNEDILYEDILVRFRLDIKNTWGNRRFITKYKEILKERFKQIDIWLTSYEIEVI